jgi:hypothetical protein
MQTRLILATTILSLAIATGCGKPEDKMLDHSEELASIMEDNVDSPADGVEEIHKYVRKNLPGMLEQVGKLLVELDEIDDVKERAERATEIAKKFAEASKKSSAAAMKFAEAVMKDEAAAKYGKEWAEKWEKAAAPLQGLMMGLGGALSAADPAAGELFKASTMVF